MRTQHHPGRSIFILAHSVLALLLLTTAGLPALASPCVATT